MTPPVPNLRTVLWRGVRRRCPQCGKGAVFKGWLKMHDGCSVCGLKYLRDQGDLWAYLVVIDRALFIFPLVVLIYFRIYVPDLRWFYASAVVLAVVFVFTLPWRNAMSLSVDYLIRRKWADLSDDETSDEM